MTRSPRSWKCIKDSLQKWFCCRYRWTLWLPFLITHTLLPKFLHRNVTITLDSREWVALPLASRPEHNLRDSDNYDGIFSCLREFHEKWILGCTFFSRIVCLCGLCFRFFHIFLLSQKILISNKRACTHANAFAFNIRQHNDDPNLNVYKFELCAARTISSCNEGCEICGPYLLISINISTKRAFLIFFLILPFSSLIISQWRRQVHNFRSNVKFSDHVVASSIFADGWTQTCHVFFFPEMHSRVRKCSV